MWARRCRPGMSPGKESHSSFSVPLIPGDMSPGKAIPATSRPGNPEFIHEDSGKCVVHHHLCRCRSSLSS
ncbi:hypothetical protein Tco_1532186 [Tanacetum coccineum]